MEFGFSLCPFGVRWRPHNLSLDEGSVSLACRHSLHVGSISGLSLDWKYVKLFSCPVILLSHVKVGRGNH